MGRDGGRTGISYNIVTCLGRVGRGMGLGIGRWVREEWGEVQLDQI